jgi:hypothetical protein
MIGNSNSSIVISNFDHFGVRSRGMIEITAFMATHARLLDRRRAELALGTGDAEGALAALAGYRNPDGGYGRGLEPDMRAPSSQPVCALHAFEVFEEIAPATSPHAVELCDWLASVSLRGGGLPFSLPGADYPGTARWFARGDPDASSLHMTTCVAGIAHRVAHHDAAVAEHPWLAAATEYCLGAIAEARDDVHAIVLKFVLQFLDAIHDREPRASAELERVGAQLPPSGTLTVAGGTEHEALRPLDFSPLPDRPLRALFDPAVIAADLDRLEGEQDADGGWHVDFASASPAGALEWRGNATVNAIRTLIANGRGG